jgi:hypothetical protein
MSAPRLEWALVDALGKTEPEFGSHAGQLGTGHGVNENAAHLNGHPAPSREGVRITNHGLKFTIEEMYGSDGSRPLDYERTEVVKADKKDLPGIGRKTLLSECISLLKKCLTGPTLLEMSGFSVNQELGG